MVDGTIWKRSKYDGVMLPNRFLIMNLFFSGYDSINGYDGTDGYELWKYDGVNAPSMVADIRPGSGSSSPSHLIEFQ